MPKSDMGSMENPIFSLSKKPDMVERHYEHNGNTLEVIPSGRGMATIWDKDILIFCVSQLVAGINLGREPSQTIRVTAYELLTATNRHTGGKNYEQLEAAFVRLRGTTLKTNLQTEGKAERRGFGLIEHYAIIERSDNDDRMVAVDIKLSDWLYRAATGLEVLTVNPDYFRLRGGLERRIYELARKHCGKQASFKIGLELLYKKTGSRSPLKQFRHSIKSIASADITPDYKVVFNAELDQVRFYSRKSKKAAQAEAMDAIKAMRIM